MRKNDSRQPWWHRQTSLPCVRKKNEAIGTNPLTTSEERAMLWRCDGCGKETESDPTGHSDWGGEITVQGPDCHDCDQPMDFVSDDARPGHVAYVSKVDAGHTLARIERELDALIATLQVDQCFCDQLKDSWCTVCLRKEQEWAEGLAKAHGV